MDCEHLAACSFYNDKMPMDHGIGAIFRKKYCMGNQKFCARYLVADALGQSFVPSALYPNMLDMAREIIEGAQKPCGKG